MRTAKIQISLRISSETESSQVNFFTAKDAKFFHGDNEDWSDCMDMQLNVNVGTPQPLYNRTRYNTVMVITRFKDGSKKCIDYIEK